MLDDVFATQFLDGDLREEGMIVCPNCNHQNPDAATQCEACYTPLPAMMACPNCGVPVQTDASFCGQCGFNLQAAQESPASMPASAPANPPVNPSLPPTLSPDFQIPDLPPVEPLIMPEPIAGVPLEVPVPDESGNVVEPPEAHPAELPAELEPPIAAVQSAPFPSGEVEQPAATSALPSPAPAAPMPIPAFASPSMSSTQLQTQVARLLHVQTNTTIEIPTTLTVIHIGKPNDRIPPDVDVSGFPNSEIVSRIHADIRVEGDLYYLEDVGSSNGTYVNNSPLPAGNRHKLRAGDRIALGKGDKVTFIFQTS
jgi:FHA domain/Double zinc ribbon